MLPSNLSDKNWGDSLLVGQETERRIPQSSDNARAAHDAEALLRRSGWDNSVTGKEFLDTAEALRATIQDDIPGNGSIVTTLHILYDKAAEIFQYQGNIKAAFEARALAAQYAVPPPVGSVTAAQLAETKARENPNWATAHISNKDTGALRGGHLAVSERVYDRQPAVLQFEFKISHAARENLTDNLHAIETHFDLFTQTLPADLQGTRIAVSEVVDAFAKKNADGTYSTSEGWIPAATASGRLRRDEVPIPAKALKIEFEGLGTVVVGKDKPFGCLYNNVKVLVNKDPPELCEERAHKMLTLLGLGPILNEQRSEDKERLLIALILRTHQPREATKLEREKWFYELPVDMLKKKIVAQVPAMKAVFDDYDNNPNLVGEVEIYPGKTTASLNNVSTRMREKGALGLMSAVGYRATVDHASNCVLGILKGGFRSTQDRYQEGHIIKGASSSQDLMCGGADQVFTRLITNKIAENNPINATHYPCLGMYQLCINLEVVNRGAYCYAGDKFGVKNPYSPTINEYESRPSLFELTEGRRTSSTNEVMIKNAISSQFINYVVCQTQEAKDVLIQKLTTQGLTTINGKLLDECILVSDKFTSTMWAANSGVTTDPHV